MSLTDQFYAQAALIAATQRRSQTAVYLFGVALALANATDPKMGFSGTSEATGRSWGAL